MGYIKSSLFLLYNAESIQNESIENSHFDNNNNDGYAALRSSAPVSIPKDSFNISHKLHLDDQSLVKKDNSSIINPLPAISRFASKLRKLSRFISKKELTNSLLKEVLSFVKDNY